MKKTLMLLAMCLSLPAMAAPATPAPEGENFGQYGVDDFMKKLISKSEVIVAGAPVTLIRYESDEGEICQQYLARATKSKAGTTTNIKLSIDQVCGAPVKLPEGLAPSGFYGMTWVPEKDGLGHHVLNPAPADAK